MLDLFLWVGWFFDSLPQDVVWLLLVVVLAILSLRVAGRGQQAREARPQAGGSTTSDLAELVELVRRAEVSPLARWKLGRRLAQVAVALRVRREAIVPRQAWDDLEDGRWPTKPELLAVLRPGHGWRLPMRSADYPRKLRAAVDALWHYAQGGELDSK